LFTPIAVFLNFFLPQHPFWSSQSSPAPRTIDQILATIRLKEKQVQYILFLLPLTATYVTLPITPWNWFQHLLGVLAPQVKKPCPIGWQSKHLSCGLCYPQGRFSCK